MTTKTKPKRKNNVHRGMARKNHFARALRSPHLAQRIVPSAKTYTRKTKHKETEE